MRKIPLVNGNYYHVLNRSIAQYKIFNDKQDFLRFMEILNLYRFSDFKLKYSAFLDLTVDAQKLIVDRLKNSNKIVDIVSHCIMPTHPHLLLKQLSDQGISHYMSRVLNSYTRYFNTKHQRKGPLYESRFKSIHIETDEQLLHLTRYHHLNAVSAGIVKEPEDWVYSSYQEYIKPTENGLCHFNDILKIEPKSYKKFVDDQIGYQKQLSKIKHLLLEDYAG